jgi:hypothetical protein
MRYVGARTGLFLLVFFFAGRCVYAVDGTATLAWDRNQDDPVGYRVYYGKTRDLLTPIEVRDVKDNTTCTITGLGPGTYYFAVTAYNEARLESGFSNIVAKIFLPLADPPDPSLPTIFDAGPHAITNDAAIINWTTNKDADARIVYGTSASYGSSVALETGLATSHTLRLTGLNPGTLYHYQVQSKDSVGNVVVTQDYTFTTAPSPDSIVPVMTLSYPNGAIGTAGNAEVDYTGIALTNFGSTVAMLRLTALDVLERPLPANGASNPLSIVLSPGQQLPVLDSELFGSDQIGIRGIKIESTSTQVLGFFLAFDGLLTVMDGANMMPAGLKRFILPEAEGQGYTSICVMNPSPKSVSLNLELRAANGAFRKSVSRQIAANASLIANLDSDLFADTAIDQTDYLRGASSDAVFPLEVMGKHLEYFEAVNGFDSGSGASVLYAPEYVSGGGWRSTLSIVNLSTSPGNVKLRFIGDDGRPIGEVKSKSISPLGKIRIADPGFFTEDNATAARGYVKVTSDDVSLAGSVVFGDIDRHQFATALPLVSRVERSVVFNQIASNETYYTGIAILNPNDVDAKVVLYMYGADGAQEGVPFTETIPAGRRISRLLTEYFPALVGQDRSSGYVRLIAEPGVASFAVFGTKTSSVLSAIPAQSIP